MKFSFYQQQKVFILEVREKRYTEF